MKPWHGKISKQENTCPHCEAKNEYSDIAHIVRELSAYTYKLCISCHGEFVDTYLIVFDDGDEGDWEAMSRWETEDHDPLFEELYNQGFLDYDQNNPNEDSDYYTIPTITEAFIKQNKE